MLVNVSVPVSAMQKMMDSPIDFYLTGSRYFGTNTASSDWDFYTPINTGTIIFLDALGFVNDTKYYDADKVMKHHIENIHVQLVSNLEEKHRKQKKISELLETFPSIGKYFMQNKYLARLLWRSI